MLGTDDPGSLILWPWWLAAAQEGLRSQLSLSLSHISNDAMRLIHAFEVSYRNPAVLIIFFDVCKVLIFEIGR